MSIQFRGEQAVPIAPVRTSDRFRDDINGLRAVAVISVLLFHFKIPYFSGGFAGVDVFFVISGFLMTEILHRRLEAGRLSILEFWGARARRIVPPLALLVSLVLAFGYFWIDALTFAKIGKESLEALGFYSNFVLWRDVGYFDARAEEKWMLHTWSLAVEWQFYLVFPLLVAAIYKVEFLRRNRVMIFALLIVASLSLCIYFRLLHHAAVFYILPFRAWELLAGGMVALAWPRISLPDRQRMMLVLVGLACILGSNLVFHRFTVWPSAYTVLPVVGACLVILAQVKTAPWAANPVLRPIGRWSYSIYLWHWPFIIGWAYFGFENGWALPVFIVCFAVGAAAIKFARTLLARTVSRHFFWSVALGWGGAAALAFAVLATGGFAFRHSLGAAYVTSLRNAAEDWGFPNNCNSLEKGGNPKICGYNLTSTEPAVAFLGDSHSSLWYSRYLDREGDPSIGRLVFLTAAACPPIPEANRAELYARCDRFYDASIRYLQQLRPRRLVISSIWTTYAQFGGTDALCFNENGQCIKPATEAAAKQAMIAALERSVPALRALREQGTEIVIVLPIPIHKANVPRSLAKIDFLGWDKADIAWIDRDKFLQENAFIIGLLRQYATWLGGSVADPLPALCNEKTCSTVDDRQIPIYMDSNHLTTKVIRSPAFAFIDDLIRK